MENLTKNYALITGGSSGIGLELAKLFARDKYDLILVARDEGELAAAASTLKEEGVDVITISKDLFDPNAATALYNEVKDRGITVDVLVNDAGQGMYGKFIETDLERELDIIQLNVVSLVVLTKLFLKDMVANKNGKILNLASIASKVPGPYHAVYHGTKAFVHSFNEAVKNELKETGVTLTSLLPGATDTDFFRKADMLDAKIVQEGDLAAAADVAADGYKALMDGKDMVVSGFKNKVQVAMSNILPDNVGAENMRKMQEPTSDGENG
jgi:short-subunit dehydrogenase